MPVHLRPTARIAPDALLPGDPGRALALAQQLLQAPVMSNHHRGLWGYVGETPSGRRLTIQATGIGGPSVAVVLHELATEGVGRAIRLGTCTALDPDLPVGALIVASAAIAGDGASRALGGEPVAWPDEGLSGALLAAAGSGAERTMVASRDLHYDHELERRRPEWLQRGARATDLGTATLFALGRRLGVAVACGLVVTAGSAGETTDDGRLAPASAELGRIADGALAGAAPAAQSAPAPAPAAGRS
jgi:uridine phosphorylase